MVTQAGSPAAAASSTPVEKTLTTGAPSSRSGMPVRSMRMPAASHRACVATDRRSRSEGCGR